MHNLINLMGHEIQIELFLVNITFWGEYLVEFSFPEHKRKIHGKPKEK
jgi:hypothetical protein